MTADDWQHTERHFPKEIFSSEFISSTAYLLSPMGDVRCKHYNDVIMGAVASQITILSIVCSIVYSDADQRKHQSSATLAFVRGIHRDRWFPRTNGQLRGKCFHLMTSSWKSPVSKPSMTTIHDVNSPVTAPWSCFSTMIRRLIVRSREDSKSRNRV